MVFGAAISGMQAAQADLGVIGNNIANAGSWGFKSSRAEFVDVYAANSTGNAIGQGTRLSRVLQRFDTSTQTNTGNSLDMAINGSGFFIMSDNGARSYTRAGSFTTDPEGYIVNASNQRLVGLQADSTGMITPLETELRINTANIAPNATTRVEQTINLDSRINALEPRSLPPTVAWAGGASPSVDTYNESNQMTIYDSLGNAHVLTSYFIKADPAALAGAPNAASPAGTANQWYVAFQIDGQDVPALVGPNNSDNLFRLNYNSDGSFSGADDATGTPIAGGLLPIGYTLSNGANPLAFTMDFTSSTQFGLNFSTTSQVQDGFTTGRLIGYTIDGAGKVQGTYSNGKLFAFGQVLLANFASPENLQKLGNTSWGETGDSGQPLIGISGQGSLGVINSGALEDSNVDITTELVGLISAQRNFQANAQTIRTADAVTQAIINIR